MDTLIFAGPMLFLSTLSLRRATKTKQTPKPAKEISIHALLAESDPIKAYNIIKGKDFYPRSPCGERQRAERYANSQQEFLSTLSLRRATAVTTLGGSTLRDFYPRSPCGERQSFWPSY